MRRILIYSALIVLAQEVSFARATLFCWYYVGELKNQIEFQRESIERLTDKYIKCEGLNRTLFEKSDSLVKLENNFNELNEKYVEKNNELLKCETKFNGLYKTLDEKNETLSTCENKFNVLNKTFIETNESLVIWEYNFNELNETFVEQNNELLKQRNDLQMCKTDNEILKTNEKRISDSYTSRIHSINVPDYGSFNVLYDNKTTEKDWIVIQQRVDGKENFFRDWNTYVAGFGSFEGDFFLGLEKIHRLTYSTRYQLLIRMEYFNGTIRYVGYGNFKVDGNETDYTLSSLGKFFGDEDDQFASDNLRWHEGMKFSTFDRDNDLDEGACGKFSRGGWWYNRCAASNLNGEYSVVDDNKFARMFWSRYLPLKSVQMMTRKYQPL